MFNSVNYSIMYSTISKNCPRELFYLTGVVISFVLSNKRSLYSNSMCIIYIIVLMDPDWTSGP